MPNRLSAFAVVLAATTLFASAVPGQVQAALIVGSPAGNFAVLGQFSNNQTNFNNGTITGDIGLGNPRSFTISNGSVVGNIRFSGASNTSGLTPDPDPGLFAGPFTVSGGGTVSGGVFVNDLSVTNAINYTNDLSQALGGNAGTNLVLGSGGSVNVGAGTLGTTGSVDGNSLGTYRVFSVTSVSFPNGIFTINGSLTDQVVLNVAFSASFNGSIVLAGGLTSDNVVINMFGGNYPTHTGGPTLTVSTNGATTTGTFLDPNGAMQMNNSTLNGRFFGGDVQNQQIVSGANINAPTPPRRPFPSPFRWPFGVSLVWLAAAADNCG
jgi:hypothetical protein